MSAHLDALRLAGLQQRVAGRPLECHLVGRAGLFENLEEAAAAVKLARKVLHARVLEARSPNLFGGAYPLRAVAEAAGLSPETVRKLERTPVGEW